MSILIAMMMKTVMKMTNSRTPKMEAINEEFRALAQKHHIALALAFSDGTETVGLIDNYVPNIVEQQRAGMFIAMMSLQRSIFGHLLTLLSETLQLRLHQTETEYRKRDDGPQKVN